MNHSNFSWVILTLPDLPPPPNNPPDDVDVPKALVEVPKPVREKTLAHIVTQSS